MCKSLPDGRHVLATFPFGLTSEASHSNSCFTIWISLWNVFSLWPRNAHHPSKTYRGLDVPAGAERFYISVELSCVICSISVSSLWSSQSTKAKWAQHVPHSLTLSAVCRQRPRSHYRRTVSPPASCTKWWCNFRSQWPLGKWRILRGENQHPDKFFGRWTRKPVSVTFNTGTALKDYYMYQSCAFQKTPFSHGSGDISEYKGGIQWLLQSLSSTYETHLKSS